MVYLPAGTDPTALASAGARVVALEGQHFGGAALNAGVCCCGQGASGGYQAKRSDMHPSTACQLLTINNCVEFVLQHLPGGIYPVAVILIAYCICGGVCDLAAQAKPSGGSGGGVE